MTARPSETDTQYSALLSRFPPEVVELVTGTLPKLRRVLPGCYELVYDYARSLVVAFGMSERGSEAIVALAADSHGVRLYFDKSLPDPKGLLEGAGAKVRSVPFESASELDRGDLRALLRAAIEQSGVTFPRSGATRIVFKSETKKRKPKQKAGAG